MQLAPHLNLVTDHGLVAKVHNGLGHRQGQRPQPARDEARQRGQAAGSLRSGRLWRKQAAPAAAEEPDWQLATAGVLAARWVAARHALSAAAASGSREQPPPHVPLRGARQAAASGGLGDAGSAVQACLPRLAAVQHGGWGLQMSHRHGAAVRSHSTHRVP